MNTGMSHHVVTLARIDEEVGLCASFHAGVEELQGVLRNNRRVVHTDDNLQFANWSANSNNIEWYNSPVEGSTIK